MCEGKVRETFLRRESWVFIGLGTVFILTKAIESKNYVRTS